MASTRADAQTLASVGLREDLYYRLTGVTLNLPPLRDRSDDVALLVQHFMGQFEAAGLPVRQLAPEALEMMRSYSWPGNVRQLENTLRQLVIIAPEAGITKADLEGVLATQPAPEGRVDRGLDEPLSASIHRHLQRYFDMMGGNLPPPGLYARILREMEAPLIEIALQATGGNQAKCADLLGINRNTLRKKITDLEIEVARSRKLM